MKLGVAAFVILAVLTGVEYAVATQFSQNLVPLVLILQIKAVLILWFFMHIKRLVTNQEH